MCLNVYWISKCPKQNLQKNMEHVFYVRYSYNTHISLVVIGVVIQNIILFFFSQLCKFWVDFENAHSPFQSYASSNPAVEVEIYKQKP